MFMLCDVDSISLTLLKAQNESVKRSSLPS
jgi:hypothetical protein